MIRTQIQLEEKQYRDLQELAHAQDISMAELVRRGVDLALAQAERTRRWKRATSLIGAFDSGVADVAEKHDQYFVDSISE